MSEGLTSLPPIKGKLLLIWSAAATVAAILSAGKLAQDFALRAAESERAKGELELRESDQRHAVRMSYLNLTTGEKAKDDVLRVLRYIEALDDDARMRAWAKNEAKFVDREFEQLGERLRTEQAKVADLQKALDDAVREKRDADVRRLSQQLTLQQQRASRLGDVIAPLPNPVLSPSKPLKRCTLLTQNQSLSVGLSETAEDCREIAKRECRRTGGASCMYQWDSGAKASIDD